MVQAARGERDRKESGETGGERLTLFSDQRTEYRLERQKKERNRKKEEGESKESDCRTQKQWRVSIREHRCMPVSWQVVMRQVHLRLWTRDYCCHMFTTAFSSTCAEALFFFQPAQ